MFLKPRHKRTRSSHKRGETTAVGSAARRAQTRFAITFVVVATGLFGLYAFPYRDAGLSETWFQRYLSGYARLAGGVLALFDPAVTVAGNAINGRYALRIVKTCDAMEANLLFLAAISAYPARWLHKLMAAGLGLATLVAINVLRICSLYFIGLRWPARFDFFHTELWPLLLVATTAGLFAVWVSWLTRRSASHAPAPSPLSAIS